MKRKQQQPKTNLKRHRPAKHQKHKKLVGPERPESRKDREGETQIRLMLEEAARLAHSDASKNFRGDVWQHGIGHIDGMRHSPHPLFSGFGGGRPGTGSLVGAQWTQVGPAPLRLNFASGTGPVAGRVWDIAIDPTGNKDQIIYLATLGGIWKSTDGGTTWAPKTDRLPWNQMAAVAIDPSNPAIIYAGASASPGPSLFRSIDAGETWSIVGGAAMLGQDVTRIVIPSPGVILVGTFINGLYRSVDSGTSFGNNAPSYNNNAPILGGQAWDLHMDTSIGNKVYACIAGQGLFVSTDGGATFPANLFSNPGAPAVGTYNAIVMAQSTRPNNNTLYAGMATAPKNLGYLGLYKSTNGGATWNVVPGAAPVAAASGQFGFNRTLAIDPQDASRVYLGFEDLWLSTNGAGAFTVVTAGNVHSDHHAITFSPQSHWGPAPTRLYVGTDGGFAASSNGGTTWNNLNEGVATILVVMGALDIGRRSSINSQYSYAGSQDNGTSVHTPGLPGTDWTFSLGGDGMQVAVDTWAPQNAYATSNRNYVHTSNAGGAWIWNAATGLPRYVNPLAVDPQNGANVYAAGGTGPGYPPQLLRSTDTGSHFSTIHTFSAGIICIAIDPSNPSSVWVGLIDGTIWRTDNADAGPASVWNSYSTGLSNTQGATSIAVDPFDSQRVVAGFWGASGIPSPNRSRHVFLTTNRGQSWTDVSGTDGGAANLPDRPVYAVALDPGSSNGLFGIAWSGNQLVIVGLFGTVLTSPDGVNFTAQAANAYNTLEAVTWTGAQFVAAGLGGTILTSPDGIAWTLRKEGPSWEALQGVAASPARTVVTSASNGTVYTSPDGVTWTQKAAAAPQALLDITWSGTQFVAVGYGGTIVTSPDGLLWTVRAAPTADNLVAVIWTGNQFVAGGLHGTILTSTNGTNWTARVSPTTNEINGLAYSGTRLVGVLNTGDVITSVDGINWALQPSATTNRLLGIAWMNGLFVAVGDRGTIVTSPDGLAWTDRSFGEAPFALICANDATVMRSIDSGATWQVLGVGLPTANCMALALDWTRTPSLLRVGTYGRSVFELTTTPTARVAVISNLAFGRVSIGSSAILIVKVFNVGSAPVTAHNFARISGSAAFSSTGTPVTIPPGGEADLHVRFQPNSAGHATAVFRLSSTDPVTPNVSVPMSGIGV